MNLYSLGLTILFGLGIFVLAYTLLALCVEGIAWLFSRRARYFRRLPGRAAPEKVKPDDLLGLNRIPWITITALALLVGLGLFLLTQQPAVLLLAVAPLAVRIWLRNYRRKELDGEVLAFLTDLRLAIPLQGSLLRALQDVAERGGTRPSAGSPVPVAPAQAGQRLAQVTARYLRGGFSGNGLDLLDRLAEDTQIVSLHDLAAWTRAAQDGTMQHDVPFEHALARLRAETETKAREHLQRIPTRLTLFVLPALLGPAIVVLLYPVVARLLAQMGGTGWGGGF